MTQKTKKKLEQWIRNHFENHDNSNQVVQVNLIPQEQAESFAAAMALKLKTHD